MWVNSGSVEPLIFSLISIPINMFKSFNINNVYNLVETFYSQDFIKKFKKKKKKEKKRRTHMILQL